jgi:hypothetical protein
MCWNYSYVPELPAGNLYFKKKTNKQIKKNWVAKTICKGRTQKSVFLTAPGELLGTQLHAILGTP